MKYNSQLTRECILDCAQQEFMEHGYQKANMRRIARRAEVTTGAMYNHFANKSVLFDALVQEPAEEMMMRFKQQHREAQEAVFSDSADGFGERALNSTDWMLDFIYSNLGAFRLIFCCSEGTRWSSYLETLAETEEQTHRIFADKFSMNGEPVDEFFLHTETAAGYLYFAEFVSHDLPYERAVSVMNTVKRFDTAGWSEIYGRQL